MDREKKGKIYIWVFVSLFAVPLGAACFMLFLQWVLSSRNTSEIIWKILIVVSALFLTILLSYRLISAIRRSEETRRRNFEKKIESELGLKPISQKALVAKFIDRINKRRFYAHIDEGYGPRHIFHGEYNGYEICLLPCCRPPIQYWMESRGTERAAV
ncbi:MAG: hypothetical protein GTO16_06820 [Candidatus Aminicenantes bacterium]|nr:hypothetical protein [Candidatus Aminicenantes bacterium]